MHRVNLPPAAPAHPGDEAWPALGLGTWRFGERTDQRSREVAAVRAALDMGYRLFDTAEMYGEGGAEQVIGRAIAEAQRAGGPARDALHLVSKCYPQHADPAAMAEACERSRKRLGVDCIDLYLLHWRGGVPLARTIEGFQTLQQRGWIRRWGVSNFSVDDMRELWSLPGGTACSVNQVYYSLGERGIEFDLLPWMREHGVPVMAYCPVDGGALTRHAGLATLARQFGATPSQVALAWLLRQGDVLPIPKAVRTEHLRENLEADALSLPVDALAALQAMFPPPAAAQPLAMV